MDASHMDHIRYNVAWFQSWHIALVGIKQFNFIQEFGFELLDKYILEA